MTYYVKLRHPHRIGETTLAVHTGKTRPTERGGTEAEFISIAPKSNVATFWATREDLVDNPQNP